MLEFQIEPLPDSLCVSYKQAKQFVETNEKYSVSLSAMISAMQVPDPVAPNGSVFCIYKTDGNSKTIEGVFGITHGELLLHNVPFLFENSSLQAALAEFDSLRAKLLVQARQVLKSHNIFSIMGEAASSDFFCEATGKTPNCKRSYILMEYMPHMAEADFSRFSPKGFLPPELFMRICSPRDAEILYPLQKEYDIVEVLPPGTEHNEFSCKIGLKKNLAHHLIYAVFYGNTPVAKAGTNALGTFYFQIGGVFTAKEWRNRHLARAAVGAVVKAAAAQGKHAVLFVKTQNEPAKASYLHAGFEPCANYEICYF
ncbi:MAG: GNAT family N-acetyltransferase [Spirochaetaceae bacterium]|nr:GNAT family N-acetyltransferase [Spirochaetaceae bacterium]